MSTQNGHMHSLRALHRKQLTASGISNKVRDARGYYSAEPSDLIRLGFAANQRRQGLVIPQWNPKRVRVGYQLRPDHPRTNGDGKVVKYEVPRGASLHLDVNPLMAKDILKATVPLLITEGSKKADAAVSHDICTTSLGGVWCWKVDGAPLDEWELIPLKDRLVYVAFDSDVMTKHSVQEALDQLQGFLVASGSKVTPLYLPAKKDGSKQGVDDYLIDHTPDDLFSLTRRNGHAKTDHKAAISSDVVSGLDLELPQVITNGRPPQYVTRDTLKAMAARNNPPLVFQRGLDLVRTVEDDEGRLVLQTLDHDRLRHEMARSAIYLRAYKDKSVAVIPPPTEAVRDLASLRDWGKAFPSITGITQAPVIRPDGSILTAPGYDAATRLVYVPPAGFVMPNVPIKPTTKEISRAVDRLEDVIGDFPFVSRASRASAYALLLTLILRPALRGKPVPLALIDAPQQGTGKGLFANVVSILATGSEVPATAGDKDEEEWRKAVTAKLLAGTTFILIDNVSQVLKSDVLSSVLTTSTWGDRILGASRDVTLPVQATWCATGNNLRVAGDLIRRCYRVRMDAKTSRPWLRKGFRHPDLIEYMHEVRAEVLAAVLTLCRGWFATGCRVAKTPKLGSFERWSTVIGGVLATAGIEGFLDDLEKFYDEADDETPEWEAFLISLHATFGTAPFLVGEVVADLDGYDSALRGALPSALGDAYEMKRGFRERLGHALKNHIGARYGEKQYYLKSGLSTHSGQAFYRVIVGNKVDE